MFLGSSPIYEFRGPWSVPVQIGSSIVLLPLILIDFGGDARSMAFDLAFVGILLVSIFLHELGHAWGCLIQGVPVRRIMLYGGGGFCERSRSATRYEQELIVAMGPIVNLFLWAGAGLIAPFVQDPEMAWLLWTISSVNGFLAVLNLLPVSPLDGGKLFALGMRRLFDARVAMIISGVVGLACAILWVPLMLYGFIEFGFILFFLPSVLLHWRMLTDAREA